MAARFLLAGLTAALCLTWAASARAQQFPSTRWTASQSVAPVRSLPLDDGYAPPEDEYAPLEDEYEYVEPSAMRPIAPMSGIKRLWHKFFTESKRNNCWPHPFIYSDREMVRTPFVVMVNNGWKRQNTLGKYHFREDTNKLTEAGELKVRWILLEGPAHHRIIYIHRARAAEDTTQRVDAVQQLAIKLVPAGELPAVLQTDVGPAGWPAAQVDNIDRKFQSSAPNPRLPEATEGSGDINQ